MPGIVAEAVTKSFGPVRALDGVDLEVGPGQVTAMIGANGAGKSTLVRVLATTVIPDSGAVRIADHDVVRRSREARDAVGLVLGEERSFFWRLNGLQNLEFFGALHGMRRAEARAKALEVVASVGLADVASRRVDRYSTGMRARLGLARALLGDPSVLLLDEPTRSLDPMSTISIRELVLGLAKERSAAVLFVTHDLHEAAVVADQVAILARGRVAGLVPGGGDAATLERRLVGMTK